MHCVYLGQSFPTSIYLQILASIQPLTSLVKFARSPRTDPPGPMYSSCVVVDHKGKRVFENEQVIEIPAESKQVRSVPCRGEVGPREKSPSPVDRSFAMCLVAS